MARSNRRQELLDASLASFIERGYEGTSVAEIADVVGVSKAAVSYHFPAKDDLLVTLAEPLVGELERLVAAAGAPSSAAMLERFLTDYAAVLIRHRGIASWLDGDRGVAVHPELGPRLERLHEATRTVLIGVLDEATHVAAASALGAVWRPLGNLALPIEGKVDALVAAAMAALEASTS